MVFYGYLHGFASSPNSAKARELATRFQRLHLPLHIPDLNQNDFSHLTLSRQIQQVTALLPAPPEPVVLIGSSFGGLTAAWLGDRHPQISHLVLLAPAFRFLEHWLPRLGTEEVHRWQREGWLSVYHYGEARMLPLHYGFVTDAQQYEEGHLGRSLPTLILHGRDDEVIPIDSSRTYAADRPWVRLVELESDHALTNVQAEIWQEIGVFLQLSEAGRNRE